jgi:cyanophycin synthetase
MNIYDEHPFKVILDYAHNGAAVKAICDLVDRFDVEGRKIVVLAAPGDRRDEDILEIAGIAAGHFDHYICRRDDNTRGRDGDEVPTMLKDKLLQEDIHIDAIDVIADEQEATRHALEIASSGDLVLVLGDNVKRTWKQIIYFNAGAHAEDTVTKVPAVIELPATDDFVFDDDVEIISDERGVRIAREEAD